jgi:hypothetical protein
MSTAYSDTNKCSTHKKFVHNLFNVETLQQHSSDSNVPYNNNNNIEFYFGYVQCSNNFLKSYFCDDPS